jgi:hypothetical protein
MLVLALKTFRDLKERKLREAGDVFEVTEERYKEINGSRYGQLVGPKPEEPKPRRRRKEQ